MEKFSLYKWVQKRNLKVVTFGCGRKVDASFVLKSVRKNKKN